MAKKMAAWRVNNMREKAAAAAAAAYALAMAARRKQRRNRRHNGVAAWLASGEDNKQQAMA